MGHTWVTLSKRAAGFSDHHVSFTRSRGSWPIFLPTPLLHWPWILCSQSSGPAPVITIDPGNCTLALLSPAAVLEPSLRLSVPHCCYHSVPLCGRTWPLLLQLGLAQLSPRLPRLVWITLSCCFDWYQPFLPLPPSHPSRTAVDATPLCLALMWLLEILHMAADYGCCCQPYLGPTLVPTLPPPRPPYHLFWQEHYGCVRSHQCNGYYDQPHL